METILSLALSNPTVTCLIAGLIGSGVTIIRSPRPLGAGTILEALLAWFILFSVGVSYSYNFIVHTFFGEMTARFIGWDDSPFQTELGYASLGYALVGFLAWRRGFDIRLAAIAGPSCFSLGAALVHVQQMFTAGNFAPGNAGVVFYTDILIPIIGFVLLALRHRRGRA